MRAERFFFFAYVCVCILAMCTPVVTSAPVICERVFVVRCCCAGVGYSRSCCMLELLELPPRHPDTLNDTDNVG